MIKKNTCEKIISFAKKRAEIRSKADELYKEHLKRTHVMREDYAAEIASVEDCKEQAVEAEEFRLKANRLYHKESKLNRIIKRIAKNLTGDEKVMLGEYLVENVDDKCDELQKTLKDIKKNFGKHKTLQGIEKQEYIREFKEKYEKCLSELKTYTYQRQSIETAIDYPPEITPMDFIVLSEIDCCKEDMER
jgi:Asp-tRNA(Asn)/Glu-tRNA(Gln) amidotransferase C subunit